MSTNVIKFFTGLMIPLSLFLLQCDDSSSNPDKNNKGLTLLNELQIAVPEPSGICYDSRNDILKVVSDQTGFIYLLSTNGNVLEVLDYHGNDPEGITIDPATGNMYVSMEEQREIVKLDSTGYFLGYFSVPDYGTEANKGVEGVQFIPDTKHLFFIYEKSPAILVESDTVGNIQQTRMLNFAGDYSGLEYLENKNALLICSDEEKALYEYSLDDGLVKSWMFDIEQIEGVAVKEDTLFLVSDDEEKLYIYKMTD